MGQGGREWGHRLLRPRPYGWGQYPLEGVHRVGSQFRVDSSGVYLHAGHLEGTMCMQQTGNLLDFAGIVCIRD